MKQLFGTDGIRGVAGEFPLDSDTVQTIGASVARRFREHLMRPPRFVSGRDTRESGRMIEAAFHAGALSEGAHCESADVITTPGVAYLTKAFEFDAGIVISASHNPFEDNGIKIFLPSGEKMGEAAERLIESDIYARQQELSPVSEMAAYRAAEFRRDYLNHLKADANGFGLDGRKIVVDCANGAASATAPELFTGLGGNLIVINAEPDGRNINRDCGSLHLEQLRAAVLDEKADLGVAFDGDADRVLFVNERGETVDGDATLWIMSQYLKSHGRLANSTVVATVMSNIGLERALDRMGIRLLRTSVGDKYVLEKLVETGSEIGGEQSGHIIFPHISLVGDGMMTALLVLRAICERNITLSEATEGFFTYPQVLLNTKVSEKRPFAEVPQIAIAAQEVEQELHGEGRLLLRYSGTENLARVMIEGKDQSEIEEQAHRLVAVIQKALG